MSLTDVSDWFSFLDPSCHIPTDVVFEVRVAETTNNDRTAQVGILMSIIGFGKHVLLYGSRS